MGGGNSDCGLRNKALGPLPSATYTITFPFLIVFTYDLGASMGLLEIIVLAVVQGLTEFIPISSTAHLRIVPALLGWRDPGAPFTAVIQIGTLAAVVSYFWRDIVRIAAAMLADLRHGKMASTPDARMGWMI